MKLIEASTDLELILKLLILKLVKLMVMLIYERCTTKCILYRFYWNPIETTDKNTRAVFGDYISTYDMTRSVEDGSTVKIYYESRIAKIDFTDEYF